MSDFKPTKDQLQILEQLKEVTEPYYIYSDQMIVIAKWIDAEFKQKGKANEDNKQPDTEALRLQNVSGLLCGSAKATKLVKGCTVYMDGASGCIGYGNIQCVSGVCEPLGEISLYGHNQNYSIDDIKEIVSYPIVDNYR